MVTVSLSEIIDNEAQIQHNEMIELHQQGEVVLPREDVPALVDRCIEERIPITVQPLNKYNAIVAKVV
jgi:hypothetical protein